MTSLRIAFFVLFLSLVQVQGAVIAQRKKGVKRYLLYRSRFLDGDDCLPACPTEPPRCPPCDGLMQTEEPCDCKDCCDLCPTGTYCVGDAADCVCVGCECGYCDSSNLPCCQWNGGGNNCNPNNGKRLYEKADTNECNTNKNRFPHDPENGNACSGVEISENKIPNGCGCKPNSLSQCFFTEGGAERSTMCFVCDVDDWAKCPMECKDCYDCILACADSDGVECLTDASTADDYKSCLKDSSDISDTCRASCQSSCTKDANGDAGTGDGSCNDGGNNDGGSSGGGSSGGGSNGGGSSQ